MQSDLNIDPFLVHYQGYVAGNTFTSALAKTTQQVRALFDGTAVKRFHTMPTTTENNVGQHSHGVAMFCFLMMSGDITANLLLAALTHDLAEQYVGDIPSPSKRTLGVREAVGIIEDRLLDTVDFRFELSAEEELVLKLADCADGMMFCAKERMLGNRSKMLRHAYRTYGGYVHELMLTVPPGELAQRVANVFTAVSRIWKENGNV